MGQKISIPQQNQPFRRQATLGGDVSFRNLSESKENNSVVMATVTKVYYKQGRVDFKLANTATDTVSEAGNGIGSAPIPVDFYGYKADGKVFGHYRPIQIGDRVAVAYLWGHQESPIILGVYPNQASSYEFVAPPFATDSGDDKDENVKEYALADRKINPDGNVTYRTGKGSLYQTLNGHSFALIDDSPLYDQLWLDYEHIGAFRDADNKEINPLTETAGEWLLVHEDNQEGENADNHRTRFYVNKHGEFQIILSKSDSMDSALVVEGSKDKGFTAQQLFDIPEGDAFGGDMNHRQPKLDKAPTYVKFNLGGSNQVASIEASSQAESQAQTTNLSVKPDGVYINGKAISDLIYNAGNKNDQKISDITNDIDDINQHLADKDKSDAQKDQELQKKWADFDQKVQDNAKAASDAAKSAEQAGDDAKAAGQAAVRAGDNAVNLTDDIKNKIIYYSSISKEKDVHIPGKYLIINTDTYIANGTIKTAYIEDGAISSAKIGNEAVGTAQIARAAVGTLQVADGAIGTAQIKDLAVTDEKVGNLTFNHMIGQTLDANKIKVKNISGDEISADTITANHLKIGSLSEISGDLGNIIKGNISASDDPNKGVVINGLDADDPDKYTASKKAALFREVNALNASYQATLAYAQSVGIDATALQQAQQAMSDGLSPLFMNMGETTTMDHNKVVELEKALQQAISDIQNQFRYQLGTTANGKSTIYSGSQQPAHPKENDLWMKDTGSGTDIEIYNGAGWVSPSLNVVNNMNTALKNMPKTFFQSAQPDPKTTQLNEGDLWYKLTKDSNGNFVYTYYKWDNSVHMWVKLLNNGEITNQSSIKQLQSDLEQAQDLIKDDGGGINLYTGTENFSSIAGRIWFHRNDANWTLTNILDPNGNPEMQKNGGAWNGLGQAINVDPGKYTFSCYLWVNLTGNDTLDFFAGDNQYGGTATISATDGNTHFTASDSDKYIHVIITYTVTNGGVLAIRPELNQDSGTFRVSSYKLEKGSQATPWTHNDNDYMVKIGDNARNIMEAKEGVDSATSAIQQVATNASSDASKIRASVDKLKSDIGSTQIDLNRVRDSLAKSQSAVQGDMTVLQKDVSGIKLTIADHDKNIHTLQVDSKALEDDMADAKGNISSLQKTSTSLTSEMQDYDGRLSKVEQTANGTQQTVTNQQGQINTIQTDANGIHQILTEQGNQIATINTTLDGLNTKYEGVSGDLGKLSDKVTANSTQITQNQQAIALKADQSTVNNLSGEVSQAQAQLKVQAGQISSKVSSSDFKTLDNKVSGAIARIGENATAIDQTNKQISLKADQTEVDKVKQTASNNSSRLDVMVGQISSKVTATDVNNIVNGKDFATTSTVQSLITQKAGTINETITNLTNKVNSNNGGGVNLVSGTIEDIVVDDTANTGTQGWRFNTIPINADLKVGDKITVSVENVTMTGKGDLSKWGATLYSDDIVEARAGNYEANAGKNAQVTITVNSMKDPNKQTALLIYSGRVSDTEGKKAVFHHLKVERGEIATPWTPAPSDNATVTQVQQITATVDGLQSTVAKKDDVASMISQKADSIEAGITGKLSSLNYGGLVLDKNGATLTSGNTHIYLNGTHGFQIQKGSSDIFHVDTDGNLTIKGDSVVGNISGVNFTGTNLNLAGSMKVSGSILAGDDGKGNAKVVINNNGLNMTSGDINLGDDKGTHVHIANDGTLTANQANISGNITATKLLLNDPTGNGQSSINLGGKFMVDSQGTVTANKFNSTNITVTGGEINGTTIEGNYIKGGTIDSATITTVTIDAKSTINGATINGTTINGTTFNNTVRTPTISGDFLKGRYNDFGGIDDRPIYQVNNAGNTLWHLSTAKVPIVKKHISGNKIEFISNSTNWGNPSNFSVGSSASLASYNKLGELRVNKGTSVGDIIQVTGTVNNFSPKFDYYFVISKPGIDLDNLYDENPNKLDNRDGVVVGSLLHSVQGKGNRINFDDTLVIDLETSNTTSLNLGIVVSFKSSSGGLQYISNTLILDNIGYSFSSGTDLWGLDKSTALTTSELIINPTGSIHLSKETGLNQNDVVDGILADIDNYSLVIQPTGLSLRENSTYQSSNSAIDIKPSGIHFSGKERNMNDAKIFFDGINGNSGVYMDSYGNIQGEDNSSYWRIQDRNGNFLADFPMDGSSPIQFHTDLGVVPRGADHGIRTCWVSWSGQSGWDGGERYPAIVQDGINWGGICFPKSGRVTLFDANGLYYSPDKNTGIGAYNDYERG